MEISVWAAFVGLTFAYCLIPGPSVCFTVAHSMQHGISRTNLTIIGQITANALYIMLACFGLGNLIEISIEIFYVVKYFGAAYIVYLGIKQIFSQGFEFKFDVNHKQKSKLKSYFDGFVISGTNPKTFFYYAAFLTQFIIPQYEKRIQLIILGLGSIIIASISLTLYNIAGKRAKDLLLKKNIFQYSHFVIGSLFILAGISLGFF